MANSDSRIENLKGSWEYVSGENFESILKELGINKVLRALAKTMKPHLTISENTGVWSFKSHTTFKTTAYTFTPGQEFEDEGHDGEKYKTIVIFEDGKWIQEVYFKDGKKMHIERWINSQGELQVLMTCGQTKATQLFRRSK